MEKLIFALYDLQGYMKALSEYFSAKRFLLECHIFTKQDSLADYMKEHFVDVLLIGQEVEAEGLPYLGNARNIIVLSEGNTVSEQSDYPVIFKYQSAEHILREIFQMTGTEERMPGEEGGQKESQTMFIGLYRPYGSLPPMEDFFAAKEGQEKKILWMDLELLSGVSDSGMQEKNANARGMSELIFFLKQKNQKLAWKLQPLIRQRNGMGYIYPVQDYRDLYSLKREDIDLLFSVLAKETGYEQIIFDLGYLNDTSLYLLYRCDRIYMPRAQTEWEENQRHSLEQLLEREGLGEMIRSIRFV